MPRLDPLSSSIGDDSFACQTSSLDAFICSKLFKMIREAARPRTTGDFRVSCHFDTILDMSGQVLTKLDYNMTVHSCPVNNKKTNELSSWHNTQARSWSQVRSA
jgi:hypothetical protein